MRKISLIKLSLLALFIVFSRVSAVPQYGKIAFVSTRDGNSEIYTMNADGSNQINLTNHGANDDSPACVMRTDGSNEICFTRPSYPNYNDREYDADWSPDGSQIVYVEYSYLYGFKKIRTMNSLTGVPLTEYFSAPSSPAWSPDGTRIAFTRLMNGNNEIWLMDADGSNPIQLTNSSQNSAPRWSPDGTKIVFVSRRNYSYYQVYTMNADGSNQMPLTNTIPGGSSAPDWTSDNRIVFVSLLGTGSKICLMNADGSNQTPLTDRTMNNTPSWRP